MIPSGRASAIPSSMGCEKFPGRGSLPVMSACTATGAARAICCRIRAASDRSRSPAISAAGRRTPRSAAPVDGRRRVPWTKRERKRAGTLFFLWLQFDPNKGDAVFQVMGSWDWRA